MPAARASRIRKTWLFIATPRRRLSDAASLNHLVRAQQQALRDGNSKRLRSPEVDDKFELRRLFDGEIARFGALEDLLDVNGGAAIHHHQVWPVGNEAPSLDEWPDFVH